MEKVPVYYCLDCGYVGSAPGNCPQCGGEMISDDVSLPHEVEEEKRYDDGLLEDEIEEEDSEEEEM